MPNHLWSLPQHLPSISRHLVQGLGGTKGFLASLGHLTGAMVQCSISGLILPSSPGVDGIAVLTPVTTTSCLLSLGANAQVMLVMHTPSHLQNACPYAQEINPTVNPIYSRYSPNSIYSNIPIGALECSLEPYSYVKSIITEIITELHGV